MLSIPILDVPSQTFQVQLSGQSCGINIYQKSTGLYCDVYVNDVLIVGGVLCLNLNLIVVDAYLGLIGDLVFYDNQGLNDPSTPGLGSRYQLLYLSAVEAAALPKQLLANYASTTSVTTSTNVLDGSSWSDDEVWTDATQWTD